MKHLGKQRTNPGFFMTVTDQDYQLFVYALKNSSKYDFSQYSEKSLKAEDPENTDGSSAYIVRADFKNEK